MTTDFATVLSDCITCDKDLRQVANFRQQRDTGMKTSAGHRLFQDVDTGRMYWAREIAGFASDWVMRDVHHPWCQTGYTPTPFSTGAMQRCDCPVEAALTGRRLVYYPRRAGLQGPAV